MSRGKQLANNALWKYLELVSVSGIQLLSTFIFARFLTPSDYGIIGMVIVFTTLANVFIESGFSQAIIREKEVTRIDYSTILYFNLVVSLILYVLLFYSSGLIAQFYKEPQLIDVCKVTFLVLPINALTIVQYSKLQREIRFKKICLIALISILLSSIISVFIAYKYRNVWALVSQNILTYAFKALLLWITTDFVPLLKFSVTSFKKYFKFSKNLLLSTLIGTIFNNIYTLIIGRSYSTTDLGFFSQADRIKNLASQTTTQVIQSVSYPILSRINNETGDIKKAYKEIISITIIFVGFIMSLLIGCAQDMFELFMGSKVWRTSGTFFILMGINGILFPLHSINQNILMVKGDSKTVLWLEIARRSIMIIILFITLRYNIYVFVSGLTIYSIVLLFLNLYFCGKPINYSVGEQFKDTLPIFFRFALIIAVMALVAFLMQDHTVILRLVLVNIAGISFGLLIFWRQKNFKNLINLTKRLIKEKFTSK